MNPEHLNTLVESLPDALLGDELPDFDEAPEEVHCPGREDAPDVVRFLRLSRSGEPVPVDMAMSLAAQGYDLEGLESFVSLH